MAIENKSAGDGAASDSSAQTGSKITRLVDRGRPLAAQTLPVRSADIPLRNLIDLYLSQYEGRDQTRIQRLTWWTDRLGDVRLADLSDDDVHAAVDQLATEPSRFYLGKDAAGQPIYKSKGGPLAPATVNRYTAALGAAISWAIKRRIAPRGFVHPCRTVERRRENNEKTRFLSDDERRRLLEACQASTWPRLYLLVLMALTTGARKGELINLRWEDVDLERGLAYCGRTKNGDPKSLPLVPAVIDQLRSFAAAPKAFVFGTSASGARPYAFDGRWRQALKAAKIRNFRFHDLRHTCASMLALSGATLLEIGDLLGHRQLQITKRYSHLTTQHKEALVNRVLGGIK